RLRRDHPKSEVTSGHDALTPFGFSYAAPHCAGLPELIISICRALCDARRSPAEITRRLSDSGSIAEQPPGGYNVPREDDDKQRALEWCAVAKVPGGGRGDDPPHGGRGGDAGVGAKPSPPPHPPQA